MLPDVTPLSLEKQHHLSQGMCTSTTSYVCLDFYESCSILVYKHVFNKTCIQLPFSRSSEFIVPLRPNPRSPLWFCESPTRCHTLVWDSRYNLRLIKPWQHLVLFAFGSVTISYVRDQTSDANQSD